MAYTSTPNRPEKAPPADVSKSSVWMDDGNIILQAENTQFCVHKSVLSINSSFFRGMFELPAPRTEQSSEEPAVVELYDKAKDVEVMIKAIYR